MQRMERPSTSVCGNVFTPMYRHGLIAPTLLMAFLAGCMGQPPTLATSKSKTTQRSPVTSATVLLTSNDQKALETAIAGLATRSLPTAADLVGKARLIGKARIVSDAGASIVANNGGGLLSDQAAGIISNNTGNIISDNGSALIANNGSSLVGKARYGLLNGGARDGVAQTGSPVPLQAAPFDLADALITFHDASGRVLVDDNGKPLFAKTDAKGAYDLTMVLPHENLVMKIKLFNGGVLSAILPTKDLPLAANTLETTLDTSSSIGAAYVLGQFVKGDQAVFNKLPASEATRLKTSLDGTLKRLKASPRYEDAELVGLGESARQDDGAVAKVLEDIKALLLGQANLGTGRKATEVPLLSLADSAAGPDGTLYLSERALGRIRAVAPDGTISTYADAVRGKVKRSFGGTDALAIGPDGALYLTADDDGRIHRIAPSGEVTVVAGEPGQGRATAGKANGRPLSPSRIAFGPDGILYVTERADDEDLSTKARIFAIDLASDTLKVVCEGQYPGGHFRSLGVTADALYFVEVAPSAIYTDRAVRHPFNGPETVLAANVNSPDGTVDPDGTYYLSQHWNHRVIAYGPDGQMKIVAGTGAPVGEGVLQNPDDLSRGPDGAIYVTDRATSIAYRLSPDKTALTAIAGTNGFVSTQADMSSLALNGPAGVAIAANGQMYISETDASLIKLFDRSTFTTVAGGLPWSEAIAKGQNDPAKGEDIPAKGASIFGPRGLVFRGDDLLFMDTGNERVRKMAPDGKLTTFVGPKGAAFYQDEHVDRDLFARQLTAGQRVQNDRFLCTGSYLAAAPNGYVYMTTALDNQVVRVLPTGEVEPISNFAKKGLEGLLAAAIQIADGSPASDWKPTYPMGVALAPDGALFVCDMASMQVRRVSGPDGAAPTVSTVAGLHLLDFLPKVEAGFDNPATGNAKDCLLFAPIAICFDTQGNYYIAEAGTVSLASMASAIGDFPLPPTMPPEYARVRKVTPDGHMTTIAGPGGRFFSDPTAEDSLVLPTALAFDKDGRLAIVDAGANLVRILPAGSF